MFASKNYLLTGASQGIGKSIAIDLFHKGANLILISRNKDDLENLNTQLQPNAGKPLLIAIDTSDTRMVENAFNQIQNEISSLDGIINCAGSFGAIGNLEQVNPYDFLQTVSVNLLSAYNIIYYGLSLLKNARRGKIINFSGGGATSAFPNYSGYSCGKIALAKLTENLAVEYPAIDCNIIAPGFIKTKLAEQTLMAGTKAGDFYAKTQEMIQKGGADIQYTLNLVSFLLSAESDGITGKLISAVWDQWNNKLVQAKLRNNKDFCSLRRIDDKFFQKIITG